MVSRLANQPKFDQIWMILVENLQNGSKPTKHKQRQKGWYYTWFLEHSFLFIFSYFIKIIHFWSNFVISSSVTPLLVNAN